MLLYTQQGQDAKALELGRAAIQQGLYDFDMLSAMFVVGRRHHDFAIAEQAMQLRIASWDRERIQGWVHLGKLYDEDMHDPTKAADAFSHALAIAPPDIKPQVWEQVPAALRPKIDRALAPPQTSASKG